jgi:hypothetical protein
MYWWCEPFDDEWVWIDPPGIEVYDWEPDMPLYNGDEGIVFGFGMGLFFDEEFNPLTQKSAKRYRDETILKMIIDFDTPNEYEVELRISPVVYNPHATNPVNENWPVYFYRVGAVFKPGELRDIIGTGQHTLLFVIDDWMGYWNSDMDVAGFKASGYLSPFAPNTCWFELS